MSGRSLHRHPDGRVTVGARKTDRRNPRRDPREKLRELANAGPEHLPIRLVFRLPKSLEGFVAPGPHGVAVQVLAAGYVRIGGHSGDQCFANTRTFFHAIARERAAFTTQGIIVDAKKPGDTYSRYLTVIRGSLVVSAGGLIEPRVYEAA